MIGTDHPKRLPCNFPRIESDSMCNPPLVFMILREPIDRLWSGYRHEVKIAGETFPLKRFLDSKTSVKVRMMPLRFEVTGFSERIKKYYRDLIGYQQFCNMGKSIFANLS